jgi:MoxR-like ATPase
MVEFRPVDLHLKVPLSGPYTRLLRRPAPEVSALGSGKGLVVFRASRVCDPMPLWASTAACYYSRGTQSGIGPDDFTDPEDYLQGLETELGNLRFLAVPAYHIRLPADAWVSELAADLTPWKAEVIERWRRRLKGAIWLSVLRIRHFESLPAPVDAVGGLIASIQALEVGDSRPVLSDSDFSRRLQEVLAAVGDSHKLQEQKRAKDREEGGRRKKNASAVNRHRHRHQHQDAVKHGVTASNVDDTAQQGPFTLEAWVAECGYSEDRLRQWEAMLRRKKQLVMYGPPGTGKTYCAQGLARRLSTGGGCWEAVQFHPSYAYEDFIQGIRPNFGVQGDYALAEGLFLRFCRQARSCLPYPCVLLIDEINRAETARVLGELLYGLEYRQVELRLAGGGRFAVPENVYIVATMNTSDRSIAPLDRALRRRFSHVRLQPEYEVLNDFLVRHGLPAQSLVDTLKRINRLIDEPDLEVGHSFFMQDGAQLRQNLEVVWQGEIEPLLEEVFYEVPDQIEELRWHKLEDNALEPWKNV